MNKALEEYKIRLKGMLQDKQYEIWDAQENTQKTIPI